MDELKQHIVEQVKDAVTGAVSRMRRDDMLIAGIESHDVDTLNVQIRVNPLNQQSGPRYFLVKISEQF